MIKILGDSLFEIFPESIAWYERQWKCRPITGTAPIPPYVQMTKAYEFSVPESYTEAAAIVADITPEIGMLSTQLQAVAAANDT